MDRHPCVTPRPAPQPPPPPPPPPPGSTRFVSPFLRVAFGRAQLLTCRMLMAPLREPHGGDVSVGCGCTGATSSFRCRCSWPRFSTTPPQGDRRRPGAGRGFEVKYTAKFREHPLSRRQAPSSLPWTWTRCRPPVAPDQTGWHPCLVHRERVQRHTVVQAGVVVPGLPALDAPVPLMVDKLEDVLKIVDLFVPAQEIEVPRISSPSCPLPRRVLPLPQTTEQLVEVPLPAAGVVQAWVRDANWQDWSRVWDSSRRIFWWRLDSGHVQWNTPPGITASPGRYINTGQE